MVDPARQPEQPALERPRKSRLGAEVALILRRYIVQAELRGGDRLPSERDLSRRLGVSHRVVREALAELADEGIIEKEHGRGAFVREHDRAGLAARAAGTQPADAADLAQARAALECGIIPLIVAHAPNAGIERLQAILDRERERYAAGESPAAEDMEFHTTLLKLAGNRTLLTLSPLITAVLRLNVYRTPALLHGWTADSFAIETHTELVEALRARDVDRAFRAMRAHLRLP